jgi:uncharacterized protein (TIGR02391 family)
MQPRRTSVSQRWVATLLASCGAGTELSVPLVRSYPSVRWDDLQLLRQIDEFETEENLGPLTTGHALFQEVGKAGSADWERDGRSFARELRIAHDAGYLDWNEMGSLGVRPPDPIMEAQRWLQEIRDIRLSLHGRDRARGRVIQRPLPDPEEDDERPITGLTLEEIARSIGDTYSGSQLPRYLTDAGIPAEFVAAEVQGSKWEYVLDVLEGLHDGGSSARRTLREFIGQWLDGRHHMPPPAEVRERLVAVLGAQGWHVREGRLVIGDRVTDRATALTPLGADVRVAALHSDVRAVASRYIDSGHPEVAIFEAFKAINARVKKMTGRDDLDGVKLMSATFSDSNPLISLGDPSSETGRNIQAGFRFMFMGAVQGIRNPDAHEQFKALDPEEAFETLAFASMLMRRLDESGSGDRE